MAAWRSLGLLLATAGSVHAQKVQLELRPHAGDTLRMRLDQSVEVIGEREGSSPLAVGSTLTMFSRAIVEGVTPSGAKILALTDSITVNSSDAPARTLGGNAHRQLVGRRMRLRLAPDGTLEVADEPGRVPREVSELVAVMPASFPREPIAVGDTWSRQMPIPPNSQFGVPLGGEVRARFRLDSVTAGGALAYVSMRGTLVPVASTTELGGAAGSVSGAMVVNRKRGWLSESRFLVQMRSTVLTKGASTGIPVRFRVKVTQHMRVSPERLP